MSKKLLMLLPLLILPVIVVLANVTLKKSAENRGRATVDQGANICGLPDSKRSTIGNFAKERSFNVGSLLSECFKVNLSADEQTKCKNVVKTNFSGMRLDYQLSWRAMEPSQGNISWDSFDTALNFARNNNLKLQFFHLIWTNHGRYVNPPNWVFPGRTETSCGSRTKPELEQIMKNHIQGMIARGGDTVTAWNVVNEAFEDDGTLIKDCYYKIIGPDYIDKAFLYAREQSQSATLVLNEFFPRGNLFRSKINGFFTYVKAAKARGIPIDAVGIQNHLLDKSDYQFKQDYLDDLSYFFQKARDAGVKVHITEMDVYQADRSQEEVAKVYKDTVAMCLNNSNCTSFAVFGVSDKNSWALANNLPDAKPVLFDETYQRKPAYNGIMDAIRESTTRICVNGVPTQTITPSPAPGLTPTPVVGFRCYTIKDEATCITKCADKYGIGKSFKCRWLKDDTCVQSITPCGE